MGCWQEIDAAPASAISAGRWTKGFVEFTVERDATVTAFSRAYVDNEVVEERLSLRKMSKGERVEGGLDVTHALPAFPLCLAFPASDFLQVVCGFLYGGFGGYVGWER